MPGLILSATPRLWWRNLLCSEQREPKRQPLRSGGCSDGVNTLGGFMLPFSLFFIVYIPAQPEGSPAGTFQPRFAVYVCFLCHLEGMLAGAVWYGERTPEPWCSEVGLPETRGASESACCRTRGPSHCLTDRPEDDADKENKKFKCQMPPLVLFYLSKREFYLEHFKTT